VPTRRGLVRLASAAALVAAAGSVAQAQAQQVPIPEEPSTQPQIELAGTGVGTLDLAKTQNPAEGGGKTSANQVNFSDSALLVGAAQRLYRGGIGSFALGGLTTDQTNTGRGTGQSLFLHQGFLDYQTLRTEAYVGRTDTPPAQIVTFPTLRGDDLITFTNLLNPFSDGANVEEHRYANVAAVTFNQGLRHFENVHVQHLIDSAGSDPEGAGLNSYGISYQWLNLPTLEAIQRVVSYGAGYEHRSLSNEQGGRSDALYAGGVFNLKPSLTNRIDLRLLDVFTFGNDLKGFASTADTFRADANQITAAVRYLHSPFGTPASELALTAGYKSYNKVDDANSFGLALTGVKRLGQGFDAVAQLLYQRRDKALGDAYGGAREEKAIQIGFVFNFNATFNQNIGPRRTLLNLNHQYIPN
jgi:hypothetical protein